MHEPVLLRLGVTATGVDQSELANTTQPAAGLPKKSDHYLLALAPLVETVRPGVPDPHVSGAVLPFGNGAMEGQVLQRMIFGPHREVVDRRIGRRRFGDRPAGQHSVTFQPHVIVQSARMVFLDDESEAVLMPACWAGGHRLWRLGRVAHAAVPGEPIPLCAGRHRGEWVAEGSQSGDHLLVLQLTQIGIVQLVPGPRRGYPGPVPAAQRVWRNGGLRAIVLTPVDEDFAVALRAFHRADDQVRMVRFERQRELAGYLCSLLRGLRAVEWSVQMDALASAGDRDRIVSDIVQYVSHQQCYRGTLSQAHTRTGIKIKN